MKPVSARASYDQRVIDRLFSSSERALDTVFKILAARSNGFGRFVSAGLALSTNEGTKKNPNPPGSNCAKRA